MYDFESRSLVAPYRCEPSLIDRLSLTLRVFHNDVRRLENPNR